MRGESPLASHMLYTQSGVLDDDDPTERRLGIEAGLAWCEVSDGTVVYIDYGFTKGMLKGMCRAHALNKPVEYRRILSQQVTPHHHAREKTKPISRTRRKAPSI